MKTLLGTKIGMTQVTSDEGATVPVTLIKAGPVTVTQVKTDDKDGYKAVQVGYGQNKKLNKSVAGHVKASKTEPKVLREVRMDNSDEELQVGANYDVSVFEVGDTVDATATSKGKGFAGTVKRHNFGTSAETHGGNGEVRRPGSIGGMYPQKVFKGKKMAGRMGHEQVTVKNLSVAYVDQELGLIGLKGAVPGPKRGLVKIGGKA